MAGRRSYGKKITVHRRGYTRKGVRVRGSTFREKDRGLPGRSGIKTNLKSGSMNIIARGMGYASSTAVPEMHIDTFVQRLAKRYGAVTAERKIQEMINLRSHEDGEAKRKFEMMKASFEKQYR